MYSLLLVVACQLAYQLTHYLYIPESGFSIGDHWIQNSKYLWSDCVPAAQPHVSSVVALLDMLALDDLAWKAVAHEKTAGKKSGGEQ